MSEGDDMPVELPFIERNPWRIDADYDGSPIDANYDGGPDEEPDPDNPWRDELLPRVVHARFSCFVTVCAEADKFHWKVQLISWGNTYAILLVHGFVLFNPMRRACRYLDLLHTAVVRRLGLLCGALGIDGEEFDFLRGEPVGWTQDVVQALWYGAISVCGSELGYQMLLPPPRPRLQINTATPVRAG